MKKIICVSILILSSIFSAFCVTEVWNGVVHVTDNAQLEKECVELNGMWEFYPSQEFQTFNREQYDMAFIKVPGSWKITAKKNFQCDIACYRLKIMGLKPNTTYSIFSRKCPATSSKFFCNGYRVAEYGVFSSNKKVAKPSDRHVYAFLQSDRIGTIELVVQVASYSNHESGITCPILFSEASQITRHFSILIIITSIIAGLLLFNSIINFSVYVGDKTNRMYLIFGLLFTCLLFENLTLNGCLISWVMPFLPYSLLIGIQFMTFWFVPQLFSVIMMSDEKFQRKIPYLDKIIFGLFSGFGIVFCAFPVRYTNYLKFVLIIFDVLYFLYISYRAGRAFADKDIQTGITLSFFILIFTGIFLDMIFKDVAAKNVILFSQIGLFILGVFNATFMALTHQMYYHQTTKAMINITKINEEYEKFISNDVLKIINREKPELVNRGDFAKVVKTILYIQLDVLNEKNTKVLPRTEFETCNIYISQIADCILKHNGFISNYLGRGCIAIFDEPNDSLFAAREIMRNLEALNEERKGEGLFYVKYSGGIHTGEIVIGTIGEDKRLDNAIVGYGMNVVSRISAVAFNEGVEFLVSENAINCIQDIRGCDVNLYKHSIDTPELNVVKLYRCFDRDDMLRLNPQNVSPKVLSIRETDKFVKVLW